MIPLEAKYIDGLRMGRAVMARLTTEDGAGSLLSAGVERFWTEHSERATLPSWVTALKAFPAEWVDFLGRWSARQSDSYVRNAH